MNLDLEKYRVVNLEQYKAKVPNLALYKVVPAEEKKVTDLTAEVKNIAKDIESIKVTAANKKPDVVIREIIKVKEAPDTQVKEESLEDLREQIRSLRRRAGHGGGRINIIAGEGITIEEPYPGTIVVSKDPDGGGSSSWGGITGTLSDQDDLQAALDAKVPYTEIDQDLSFAAGANRQILVADQAVVDTSGDGFTMKAGNGNGNAANGGSFLLQGGDRGETGLGGNVDLRGGQGDDLESNGHVQIINPISGAIVIFDTDLPTENRTYTFPDKDGAFAMVSDVTEASEASEVLAIAYAVAL